MTLSQVIRGFEIIASHQPSINMIVQNDIFRLNAAPDAKYGVFGWTQGIHTSGVKRNLVNYQFTFFYVDRLTENLGNQIEIQSVGVQTLDNIIKAMHKRGLYVLSDYTFQTFNQRFSDECAGVFCNVIISASATAICPEEYGDFLESDFNDDFLIF